MQPAYRMVVEVFALGLGLLGLGCAARAEPPPGVAVVELFGSEGCSSCPPADEAVGDLIRTDHQRPVFVLAFHVDYWDHLGWSDPYADPAYTARQSAYVKMMNLRSMYTPQVIVNGRREFVGSDRARLRAAVDEAVKAPAVELGAIEAKLANNAYVLTLGKMELPAGTKLCAALVENGLSSRVLRGENQGRTLKHERVVRAFASRDASEPGEIRLEPHVAINRANAAIVVFAQRESDLQILGAKEVTVPQ